MTLLGMAGTSAELLLLEHYEDGWQVAPLGLLALGVVTLIWHACRPVRVSQRVLQATMALFLMAGLAGVGLHFRANLEFQMEMDADQRRSEMFWKVLRAKSPPALAPGVMVQLGLLGLIYAYTAAPASAGGSRGVRFAGGDSQ